MVALPEIAAYTPEQIAAARGLSPAVARYLDLIQQSARDTSGELRLERHRRWCEAALAVLFKTRTPEEVCRGWSLATRAILKKAWQSCGLDGRDVVLMEMGKLGAEELNLSSDIDIFFVSRADPERDSLKKVRQFVQLLSEVTALGFCYRVDMDLRPGGSSSPLILSFDQMTNHYGYQGETWERVAIVRQHMQLGPRELIDEIREFCGKFAFRRHIDYGLFSDLFSMRERIQAHRSSANQPSLNVNIKFQPGGIRDLELLVHSLQLIHGGKNASLRTGSTTAALEALKTAQLLKTDEADFLRDTYWFYRDLENKIQLHGDAHTYELTPAIANLIPPAEQEQFLKTAGRVRAIVDQLLSPFKAQEGFVAEADLEQKFAALGLTDDESLQSWKKLLHAEARSREKTRDEQERRKFLNTVLDQLRQLQVDNRMALYHLSQFIATVKAKASFFSLLNQHVELVEEIVWIFSCSPYLSQILLHRPELIDSFLLKNLEIASGDESLFHQSLRDYKLLSELVGASSFLRNRNVEALTQNLSRTTDTIILALLDFLKKKMGVPLDILTLGKWAGHEMGLTSDLDFVFIAPETPSEKHVKTARRFINFLHSTGQPLYTIDLRLRPSGHAGPLLLTLDELRAYLGDKAQIWERQAYMSNRSLRASQPVELMEPRPLTDEQKKELAAIQAQLLQPVRDSLDIKKSHGGLLHTEFALQIALLDAGLKPPAPGIANLVQTLAPRIGAGLGEQVLANYQTLRTYQQLLILVSGNPSSQIHENAPAFEKLCLISRNTPKVLFEELCRLLRGQEELLNKLDPLWPAFKIKE